MSGLDSTGLHGRYTSGAPLNDLLELWLLAQRRSALLGRADRYTLTGEAVLSLLFVLSSSGVNLRV